jgi:hypothetical protein
MFVPDTEAMVTPPIVKFAVPDRKRVLTKRPVVFAPAETITVIPPGSEPFV